MSYETDMTIEYYETNADAFVDGTINANMDKLRTRVLQYVPDGGTILDFGCGSGRDSKAFLDEGYHVVSLDGSSALCATTREVTGQPAICCKYQDYWAMTQYDGIWACASLLHLTLDELPSVLSQLEKSLKPGAVIYMSFKYGDFSGERNGRWFTDMTEERLRSMMSESTSLEEEVFWKTNDARPDRTEKWLNCIYRKATAG